MYKLKAFQSNKCISYIIAILVPNDSTARKPLLGSATQQVQVAGML